MKHLLIWLALVGSSPAAWACDCAMTPLKQHINTTPYLLSGEVVEILDANNPDSRAYQQFLRESGQESYRGYNVRIRVLESFKGKFKAGDVVELKPDYSSCGMSFSMGEKYVLFLYRQDNALFITHCSYSNRLNGSKEAKQLMQTIYTETRRKRRG
jgi:Tissue inhibitor of metalloproteinase